MGCCASKQQDLFIVSASANERNSLQHGRCQASSDFKLLQDIPRTVSTTDTWALRQKSFQGGCKVRYSSSPSQSINSISNTSKTVLHLLFFDLQLLPFTAACPASYPYQSLTRVVLGDGHLFAALWEGHGGSQAARHCVSNCYELLLQCMQSNPDPCWALRQTTQQLDKTYLASPDLPDAVSTKSSSIVPHCSHSSSCRAFQAAHNHFEQ
jgi:hypothetical protein